MKNSERIKLERIYGKLYKRVSGIPWDVCAYCGEPKQVYDHVPPISVAPNIDVKRHKKQGRGFHLIPSCASCNRVLSNYASSNIYDRLDYLIKRVERKLDKIEFWSEDELKEMGRNMRSHILSRQQDFSLLVERHKNLVENFCGELFTDLEIE